MYLIAWPDQTRWTTEDNRRSKVPIDREDIESRLADQAHAYSASGRTIDVVHIDIPYGRIDGYDDRHGHTQREHPPGHEVAQILQLEMCKAGISSVAMNRFMSTWTSLGRSGIMLSLSSVRSVVVGRVPSCV